MDIEDGKIPEGLYCEFLSKMPQVSVELFLTRNGQVVLVKRSNEPAKGEWFWPGSRLYKGEKFDEAARRVGREELGIKIRVVKRLGIYSHFWESSPFEKVETTHTVNVLYHVKSLESVDDITLDEQHSDYKFVSDLKSGYHMYVKKYLNDNKDLLRG